MKLVIADIEVPALGEAAGRLRADGADVLDVVTDVSQAHEVEQLAEKTVAHYGAVHVVCNNAGVAGGGPAWDISLGEWEWVLGVNLWGVVHGVRSFVPRMLRAGEGHIVNTASMAGLIGLYTSPPYAVSKFGVVALSESLYSQLKYVARPSAYRCCARPGYAPASTSRTGTGRRRQGQQRIPRPARRPGWLCSI